MKTYYAVATTIYDSPLRAACNLVDSVQAEQRPESTFRSDNRADRYVDWFDSKEEALAFIEESKSA